MHARTSRRDELLLNTDAESVPLEGSQKLTFDKAGAMTAVRCALLN